LKILSLLIAFAISHHWPTASRLRRFEWLLAGPVAASGRGPHWLPVALLAALALVIGGLATAIAGGLAGLFGLLLLGIASVLYTLGPEHLDRDIRMASNPGEPDKQQVALERLLLTPVSSGPEAAAASLHAALARWFGIVFWFVVLGVPGALLYRSLREAHHGDRFEAVERAWMGRVLGWMNWPVVALMTGAIALMTDYDRVKAAFDAREDRWQLPAALLDDLARTLCDPTDDLASGLADGRRLAWRALGIWFAVLSLLLLAGLLS
tara:strand:- start:581 stop:1378 length:798 start_codon:yes stop_codon:yes gene_type:complete